MSQKPTHNSKRRPPGESTESAQQDADWGFDSTQADPAVEKKLAIALVVCLLAGFGFVFYQKFRILQNNDQPVAAADDKAQHLDAADPQDADASAGDPSEVAGSAAGERDSSIASTNTQRPFYEASDAEDPPPSADEAWTLTQAEVPQPTSPRSSPPTKPAELPPLPETAADAQFNPFGGAEAAAASTPASTQTTPDESPTFVWDDPVAPAQAEPQPESLPAVAPQPGTDKPPSQANPFLFASGKSPAEAPPEDQPAADSELPIGGNETGAAVTVLPPEPQMLFIDEEPTTSQEQIDKPPVMSLEPLPAQAEPQPPEVPITEAQTPPPGGASAFDPFAGDANAATSSDSADHSDLVPAPADAFDPFAASQEPAATAQTGQTGSSMEIDSAADAAAEPAGDPFAFPVPATTSTSQAGPAAAEPALEPLPAASEGNRSKSAAAPVWPGNASPAAPATTQAPAPFRAGDSASSSGLAPRQLPEPQQKTIAPGPNQPASPFKGTPHTPQTTASLNPFALDNGTSQPLINSTHDAQRVVGEREITVTPSDSFWSISEREYGNSRYFTALAKYNQDRVAKPEELQSGMKIVVPPPEVLEDRFPEFFRRTAQGTPSIAPMSGSSSSATPPGLFLDERDRPAYRVGERDTLSTIAEKHLGRSGRWTEIYELNRDRLKSPATLTIGMELKLPLDASGAQVSPAGGFGR